MTINNLTTIDLLIALGLAATFPAVVSGILGTYFHGRTALLRGTSVRRAEELRSAVQTPNLKHDAEREAAEDPSRAEAPEPRVVKMPLKKPSNSRPRKAA